MRKNAILSASCPARLDIGNSLDYPSFFYSLPNGQARTTNLAIELRTTVSFTNNKPGLISFHTDSFVEHHHGTPDVENSRFPMVCMLLNHVGVTSGSFHIHSDIPVGSGLGGSGALLIALLALLKQKETGIVNRRDWSKFLITAHLFENWLGFSNTGFHDQLAALFGGANMWTWGTHFRYPTPFYRRTPIVPKNTKPDLHNHLLLCFTGQPHQPTAAHRNVKCLSKQEIPIWLEVSEHAAAFASALRCGNWKDATLHLNAECAIRERLKPGCLSRRVLELVRIGRARDVGCRYTGHGHGGCVWACGEQNAISETCTAWTQRAGQWKDAWVVKPKLAIKGLVISS